MPAGAPHPIILDESAIDCGRVKPKGGKRKKTPADGSDKLPNNGSSTFSVE
jgi:hypothetical protein